VSERSVRRARAMRRHTRKGPAANWTRRPAGISGAGSCDFSARLKENASRASTSISTVASRHRSEQIREQRMEVERVRAGNAHLRAVRS